MSTPVSSSMRIGKTLVPKKYGDFGIFSATLTPTGPIQEPLDVRVEFILDGELLITLPMMPWPMDGTFVTFIPATLAPSAGTHTLVARFPGTASAPASESEPFTFTVAQEETSTQLVSPPSAATAFTPIDVRAQVSSGLPEYVDGSVELLADGAPIGTAELDATGEALFSGVEVPWGTTELSASYVGGPSGNWAVSASEASPISVDALGTSAELSLSAQRIRAIDTVTASVEVRVNDSASRVDPRGGIEISVDGEPVYTEVSSDDRDAPPGDGVVRFDVELGDLAVGDRVVTARYLPAPGFGDAESLPMDLTVSAVETAIAASASEVRGTPAHPARVSVTTELIESDTDGEGPRADARPARSLLRADAPDSSDAAAPVFAPSGTVQTLVEGEPFGEPFAVRDGAGSGLLAGLPIGTHEVELRFVPDTQGLLPSSTFVTATVAADPDTDGGGTDGTDGKGGTSGKGGKAPAGTDGAKLAASGSELQNGALIGGAALLLGAGAALGIARQRRRG